MFKVRIQNIRKEMRKQSLDAVLISSVSNIAYLTGLSNFSKEEREVYLLISKDAQFIIADGRYTEAVKKQAPHFILLERNHKNTLEDFLKSLKKKIKSLGIEEDNLTVAEYKLLTRHFTKLKHADIRNNRSLKSVDEIKKIEQAAKIGDQTFEYILKKIRPGISEKELAFEMEYFIKKHGATISFPSIVAFGKNSSVPHHQTGNTKLTEKDKFTVKQEACFILLDFGVKYENYCSDMTRTIFFGKPTEKQKKIYEVVLEAQQKAATFLGSAIELGKKVGASEVDKIARDYLISKGYPTVPHSLGHGIGLEVHEHPSLSPHSKDTLKEGMVFSIEPGIYLPNFGGVRVEDLFVLKRHTLKQLTRSPKKLTVV